MLKDLTYTSFLFSLGMVIMCWFLPLANFQYTAEVFYMFVSSSKRMVKGLCGGLCVFYLEEDYNLNCSHISERL